LGGAAGPGKTKALLWEAILQANEVAGLRHAAAAAHIPGGWESSLLAYFRRDVPRKLYRSYKRIKNTSSHGTTVRPHTIWLLPQRERRFTSIKARSFCFIGLDELTHFTMKQWQFSDEPQSLPPSQRVTATWRERQNPGKHRARVGQSAVGGSRSAAGI